MRNTRSLLLAPPTFWFRWHSCDNEWAIRGALCQHRLGSSQCSVLIKQSDSPCRKSDFPFPIFMVVSQFHEPNTSESWGNNQNVKTGCKKLVSHSTLYESSISFYFELHFRALWLNMKAPSYLCIAKSYCWNAVLGMLPIAWVNCAFAQELYVDRELVMNPANLFLLTKFQIRRDVQ